MNWSSLSRYSTTRNRRKITISTLRPTSRFGSSPGSYTKECRHTLLPSKQRLSRVSTSTSTSPRSSSRRKRRNISPSPKLNNDQPASKWKHRWLTTTPTKKEIKSTTSGSANIFARRTRRIKRLHWPDVILNSMLVTQQLIYSMKKEQHTIVSFSLEGAARAESTVSTITKSHASKTASALIKQRTSSAGLDSAHSEKIWRELAVSPRKLGLCMLVNIDYQETKTEWLKCMRSFSGILQCGVTLKTSTFFLTKAMLSSNTLIVVWLNLLNRPWLIKHWMGMRCWL